MDENKFEWTDELVREYLNSIIPPLEQIGRGFINGITGDSLNNFKAKHSKQQSVSKGYTIYSVRRLSDGEVISIGDIDDFTGNEVTHIYIENNEMRILTTSGYKHVGKFKKRKQKQVLFTTFDGKEIHEGERYYVVIEKEGFGYEPFTVAWLGEGEIETANYKNGAKFFADKEKANEYILMNKPCLSLNDIFGILTKFKNLSAQVLFPNYESKFKQFAEQKINNQ
jgi:predicted transcriptional regulator